MSSKRAHNGFGGLFENELQFPPDVRSAECDLMNPDVPLRDKKFLLDSPGDCAQQPEGGKGEFLSSPFNVSGGERIPERTIALGA